MKNDWIYNFHKILQNHKDVSDYERFYISYKAYLKENENEHLEISKVLLESLTIFKNSTLLSIAYRLISELKIEIKISRKLLKSHFRNRSLRRYLFPIFSLTNTIIKTEKIINLLYDEKYEDKHFFEYISNRKDLLEEFLGKEDLKLLRKQLLIILHTKYFYNLDYFIKFVGSQNKHIGFLVYEVISLLINEKCEIESNIFKIQRKEDLFIEITKRIEIESLDNFLIYFLCFMENKEGIFELIKENNVEEIESILKKSYIKTDSRLNRIKNLNLYSLEIKSIENKFDNLIFEELEDDYEFLFKGSNYKSISDCVEL